MSTTPAPSNLPKTPTGLRAPGRKLWDETVDTFELAPHELVQLEDACRIRDTIDQLRRAVDRDGLMLSSSQGDRLHPGIAEARAQRLALARILATLDLPALDADLPTAGPVRGVYKLGGTKKRRRTSGALPAQHTEEALPKYERAGATHAERDRVYQAWRQAVDEWTERRRAWVAAHQPHMIDHYIELEPTLVVDAPFDPSMV